MTAAIDEWHFLGPAFKYKRYIKLLSDRLPKQLAMAATMSMINGGDSWNLTLKYVVKGDELHHGQGFALWLSKKDVFSDLLDFISDTKEKSNVMGFGVGPFHSGYLRRVWTWSIDKLNRREKQGLLLLFKDL